MKRNILLYTLTFGLVVMGYSQTNNQRGLGYPTTPMNVAVLIYDDVELLDFAGPLEVFSLAYMDSIELFNVYTVGLNAELITSQKVLQIKPQYTLDNCPIPDIIVLPGGDTRLIKKSEILIRWLRENIGRIDIALSVCTGVSILGEAGLLENQTATTHKYSIESIKEKYTNTTFLENRRFVDNGKIITTAGISAGIDGSLHVVQKLFGKDVANGIVDWMEYDTFKSNNREIDKVR